LKTVVAERLAADPSAGMTLERHAGNPAGYEEPLRDAPEETGAADDTIVDLARELLSAADPQGAQVSKYVSKYNVHVKNSQGTVIGDNAHPVRPRPLAGAGRRPRRRRERPRGPGHRPAAN
jgi:hypothetical protein